MVLSMVIATRRERTVMRWNIDLTVCAPSVACSPLRALAAEKISRWAHRQNAHVPI